MDVSGKNAKALEVVARLRRRARESFRGRERELSALEEAVFEADVPVTFVHGIGGIGKTALLDAAHARLCERGARVLRLGGDELEPTPQGFLAALATALGSPAASLDELVAQLANLTEPQIVIMLDEYDGLRLLDAWLRRSFVAALSARVHLLCAGRSRPVAAWLSAPGWDGLVRSIELGPLAPEEAAEVAAQHELAAEVRAQICSIAQGHPLALKLAAAAAIARPGLPIAELESRHVIDELVRRFLADVRDPADRGAVEAAAVLRRVTRPLLVRMLGEAEGARAFQTLRTLPFVEVASDGLVLHQSVRQAVEKELRALDPARHQALRSLAWQQLSEEIVNAPQRRWQVTADVVYLVDQPMLREAFFPTDAIRFGVEPAEPADREAILTSARTHLGPDEAHVLSCWWEQLPQAFFVVRDAQRKPIAFHIVALEKSVPPALLEADPLLRLWQRHFAECRPNNTQPVLWNRAALSARCGTAPSEERASCFIDIKRLYLENLDLAAIYAACNLTDDAAFAFVGFTRLVDLPYTTKGGTAVTSSTLQFGDGVLAWLTRLIGAQSHAQVTVERPATFTLDRNTRELCVHGERKALTRLEYGVLDQLEKRRGVVVSRDELLSAAWGQAHTGSNVVDAVVRTLRKKLGAHSDLIQTVTGFGYKLRAVDPMP